MNRFTFEQHAGPNTVFTPGSFGHQVGTVIPFSSGDRTYDATVIGVTISADGKSVEITLDVPDAALPRIPLDGLSIDRDGGPDE